MANSIQEQLLKAGLVDEKRVNKSKKAKQRKEKEQRHNKHKTLDESTQRAKQAMAREAERNRELNRKKNAEAQKKALAAQIRQLIEMNRQPQDEGEIAYNFNHAGKIRRVLVTEKMHGQLSRGQLAIVTLDEGYEIVPTGVAEKIRLRDESCLIVQNQKDSEDDSDDPYADFKVPDDLMW